MTPTHPDPIPDRVQPPLPAIMVDDEPEFEISEILDSKIDNLRRACKLLYLVWWMGYEGTDEETSWILATELGHATELVSDFHLAYPSWAPYHDFDQFCSPQSPMATPKPNA